MIELTVFKKLDGPLTKRISLGPDGEIRSDGSACVMSRGTAKRFAFADIAQFATLIEQLGSNQAIALGRFRPGAAQLDPCILRALGSDEFPPAPIRIIGG